MAPSNCSQTWKHLADLDEIYKKNKVCEPLATASSSSGLQVDERMGKVQPEDHGGTGQKKKKKRKADDVLQEYLLHRMEMDKIRSEELKRMNDILERLAEKM